MRGRRKWWRSESNIDIYTLPAVFLWDLEEEENGNYFPLAQVYVNLISDAEIRLDFLITHHGVSVMKLAAQ